MPDPSVSQDVEKVEVLKNSIDSLRRDIWAEELHSEHSQEWNWRLSHIDTIAFHVKAMETELSSLRSRVVHLEQETTALRAQNAELKKELLSRMDSLK